METKVLAYGFGIFGIFFLFKKKNVSDGDNGNGKTQAHTAS